jgi:hypothetical protein
MYTLILLISLKSQFHHDLDLQVVPNLADAKSCQSLGNKLSDAFKLLNPDVTTQLFCEASR